VPHLPPPDPQASWPLPAHLLRASCTLVPTRFPASPWCCPSSESSPLPGPFSLSKQSFLCIGMWEKVVSSQSIQRAMPSLGPASSYPRTFLWAARSGGIRSQLLTIRLSLSLQLCNLGEWGGEPPSPPEALWPQASRGCTPYHPSKGLCVTTKRLCPFRKAWMLPW
jgi:hypothetical protein